MRCYFSDVVGMATLFQSFKNLLGCGPGVRNGNTISVRRWPHGRCCESKLAALNRAAWPAASRRFGQPSTELWNNAASKGLGRLGTRCFMRTNRTPDEWDKWCLARGRIADELIEYNRACTMRELPPQLLALSEKLDQELLKKQRPIAPS